VREVTTTTDLTLWLEAVGESDRSAQEVAELLEAIEVDIEDVGEELGNVILTSNWCTADADLTADCVVWIKGIVESDPLTYRVPSGGRLLIDDGYEFDEVRPSSTSWCPICGEESDSDNSTFFHLQKIHLLDTADAARIVRDEAKTSGRISEPTAGSMAPSDAVAANRMAKPAAAAAVTVFLIAVFASFMWLFFISSVTADADDMTGDCGTIAGALYRGYINETGTIFEAYEDQACRNAATGKGVVAVVVPGVVLAAGYFVLRD